MTPEQQLALYEKDVNAERNIRDAITKAYQDLKPESEAVHTYENQQFPAFYGAMSGYGTSAADLSPTTLLQNAFTDVGNKSTTAQVARDVFDVRRAGMEDLIKSGLNQWQTGYAGAQSAWERWWAQKQHEDQMRLANRQLDNTLNLNPKVDEDTELIKLLKAAKEEANYQKTIQGFKDQNVAGGITERNNQPITKIGNFLSGIFGGGSGYSGRW